MTSKAASSAKSSTGPTQSSNPSDQPPASPANWQINYRAHNGYDQKTASLEATIPAETYGESLTVQAHAEDADINVLMRRYGITGKMPENPIIPTYGDFSEVIDYRTALEAVNNAHNAFMEIPAELRARFDNDPQLFLEYTSKAENLPEMRRLGLAKPEAEAPPLSRDTTAIIDALKTKADDGKKPPST